MNDMILSLWQEIRAMPDFWGFISIPLVAAIVTWVHVWIAMKMVFYPLEFVGIAKPWLGWQGIIPRRAGKMAGIVVDNTLQKLGSLEEFFRAAQPEIVIQHVVTYMLANVESITDEVMGEKNAVFWENMPVMVKRRVYTAMRQNAPRIAEEIVQDMASHIDSFIDLRQMVVSRMSADKALVVRIFQEVGHKEIDFIVNASFWIGLFFGVIQMICWYFFPYHWGLPLYGAALGYLTNWVALNMVFRPLNPVKIGPWKFQGLFLKRQDEVSEKFAEITAQEILSVNHFMTEIITGKRSDRTTALIKRHLQPVLDSMMLRTTIQMMFGWKAYANFKTIIVEKIMGLILRPLSDNKLNKNHGKVLEDTLSSRMKQMTPAEFQDLLRPAFQEDEWILIAMGAIMGFIAGWIQLLLGFK